MCQILPHFLAAQLQDDYYVDPQWLWKLCQLEQYRRHAGFKGELPRPDFWDGVWHWDLISSGRIAIYSSNTRAYNTELSSNSESKFTEDEEETEDETLDV